MSNRVRVTALGGLLLCAAARPLWAQPFFSGIGSLDGAPGSWGSGVSADGRVALGGSYVRAQHPYEAVKWTADQGIASLAPGRQSNTVGGASGTGSVLTGLFSGNGTTEGFRWTAPWGAIGLGDLPGGEFRSSAGGVSARGDILVGGSWSANGEWEAFRWTAQTGLVALGDLPGGLFRSGASRISADGRVIVGYGWSEEGQQAMRWTASDGMLGLGDLPGGRFESVAWAVSADGSVVVGTGWDGEGQRAFRWTEQTGMVALERIHPDQSYQRAHGASWDCNVVVGETDVIRGPSGAFYWTAEDGTRWLTDVLADHGVMVPDGWRLERAHAVSADGCTIVGYGLNPQRIGEGWVAYLGPACRADYDEDGSVTTADVLAYLSVWTQRSIFGDWNYDGFIDTRDLIGFLEEWAAGC